MGRTGYQSEKIFAARDELAGEYIRWALRTLCLTCDFFFKKTTSLTNLDYFWKKLLKLFKSLKMVKRPGLGKLKRVSTPTPQPEVEEPEPQAQELPETQSTDIPDLASQAADEQEDLVEGTQEGQTQGRFKKKRLVRMTDAQEDEMAEWLQNHPEMYNKAKKEYRDTDRKEAAWEAQARVMGMEGEFLQLSISFSV